MKSLPQHPWTPIDDVLAVIRDPKWMWPLNSRCKYVTLRLDVRDFHCIIMDRDGNEITLDELKHQHEE